MKTIGRILIILGVAWLVVMGLNWLRVQNLLPVNQTMTMEGQREGWRGRERDFGAGRYRSEEAHLFAERGDHHYRSTPSLADAKDMLGTLAKIGIITVIVIAIDRIIRLFNRRKPQPAT